MGLHDSSGSKDRLVPCTICSVSNYLIQWHSDRSGLSRLTSLTCPEDSSLGGWGWRRRHRGARWSHIHAPHPFLSKAEAGPFLPRTLGPSRPSPPGPGGGQAVCHAALCTPWVGLPGLATEISRCPFPLNFR